MKIGSGKSSADPSDSTPASFWNIKRTSFESQRRLLVRVPDFYRYFFAFRPDPALRCWLASLADAAGQSARRIKAEYFHLTLCVVAELVHRDRFIVSRADSALAGRELSACPLWLGRVHGGARGAAVRAMGRQHEIQYFYRMLLAGCRARGSGRR
jgi:hypothetical protein